MRCCRSVSIAIKETKPSPPSAKEISTTPTLTGESGEGVTFSSGLTYIAILEDSNWIVFRREIHAHARSAFVKDFDWIL